MLSTLKSAALAALVSIPVFATAPASAQDAYLGLGGGRSGPSVEFFVGDGRGFGYDRRDDRRWDRHERRDRRWDHDERCHPEQAVRKAERMGVRRARVADVGRRTIDVIGRDRGDRVFLTFGRAPGCPLLRG